MLQNTVRSCNDGISIYPPWGLRIKLICEGSLYANGLTGVVLGAKSCSIPEGVFVRIPLDGACVSGHHQLLGCHCCPVTAVFAMRWTARAAMSAGRRHGRSAEWSQLLRRASS